MNLSSLGSLLETLGIKGEAENPDVYFGEPRPGIYLGDPRQRTNPFESYMVRQSYPSGDPNMYDLIGRPPDINVDYWQAEQRNRNNYNDFLR